MQIVLSGVIYFYFFFTILIPACLQFQQKFPFSLLKLKILMLYKKVTKSYSIKVTDQTGPQALPTLSLPIHLLRSKSFKL